jgi:pimeloyl-ACP methyl ester carboxylesterase
MERHRIITLLVLMLVAVLSITGHAQKKRRVPAGSSLDRIVENYLGANETRRVELRAELDQKYKPPLLDSMYLRARNRFLSMAADGPVLQTEPGTHYFYADEGRGKYILEPGEGDTLFIGLHGGGGEGWVWIFPEVLEKTERGWVDTDTDRFVLELVEAAKRAFKIDPDRIYVSGHSMGGHGTWSLAAHHPDIFAGGAAYAGGPSPIFKSRKNPVVVELETGLLPNLYRQTFLFFQSGDDPRVPPGPNDFASEQLARWKEWFPDGFRYRYERVEGRGHSQPAEGYLPTQTWVASYPREPLPRSFLWQPTKPWKRQFYWLYWHEPQLDSLIHVIAHDDNHIEINLLDPNKPNAPQKNLAPEPGSLTLFLKAPIVDLSKEVKVSVNGQARFEGKVEPALSTLLWTLPRNDPRLLFDARLDLEGAQ